MKRTGSNKDSIRLNYYTMNEHSKQDKYLKMSQGKNYISKRSAQRKS